MYRFGDYTLDADGHSLRLGDRVVYLRPKSFDTLLYLIRHAGHVVRKTELLDNLWAGVVVTEGTLTHCIEDVRSVLQDDARHPRFIQTVPRIGYRFISEVWEDGHFPPDAAQGGAPAAPRRALGRWDRATLLLAASVLVGGIVIGVLFLSPSGRSSGLRSLAVLPFANLNNDPNEEYFADGMTEALTADLARISGLRVISRTSAMQYKGVTRPLRDIARELNVDAVVEGSVLRSGDRVRITAQLIDAHRDEHLWGEAYERDQRNIIALLRVMARTIALEVQIELTPQEHADLAGGSPVDPHAFESYLKGRFHWNKRNTEEFQKGIAYFEQAIRLDSSYAPAYAGIADCYNMLGDYDAFPPKEVFPKAIAAASKALKLDPSLPEGHASLGFARMRFDWNWPEAEQEFRQAIAFDPNYASAHHWYGLLLTMQGRFEQAETEVVHATELDPLSLITAANMGWLRYFEREYDLAVRECQEAVSLDPGFSSAHIKLGWAYEQTARYDDAIKEFQRALEIIGNDPSKLCLLAHARALRGQTGEAQKILREVTTRSTRVFVSSYHVAVAYAALGDREQAFAWLDRAYEERSGWLCWLKVDPKLDVLRSDPRFSELLHRVALDK